MIFNEYSVQLEDFFEVKEECDSLIKQHWDEVAFNKESIPLNPDWDFYSAIYLNGYLGIYTVRKGSLLVGYLTIIARPHHHYKDHIYAVSDLIFLHKDHRKGLAGYKLLKFAEEDLKDKGVSVTNLSCTTNKDLEPLFTRLGYTLAEKVYSKHLGE